MFIYKKNLQYPVRIANPNPALAKVIISQYGGPNGELGASLRYLSQRFAMPSDEVKGILTDIGTEELGHLEMVGSIVHQLTRNLTPEEIKAQGFDAYFVDHTLGGRAVERHQHRRQRRCDRRSHRGPCRRTEGACHLR